jgi:hypothetical protein
MSDETDEKLSVGKRDKTMSDMASIAAEAFCDKHTSPSVSDTHIRENPETYLAYTIPYLTVRILHRHEKALKSLEADSRWIKFLTVVLVALTIVLAYYAWRLDAVIHAQRESSAIQRMNASPAPSMTPPGPTSTP